MYQIERQNRCILQTLSTLHQSNNTRKTEEEILGVQMLFGERAFGRNETAFRKNKSAFRAAERAFCSSKTFRLLVD